MGLGGIRSASSEPTDPDILNYWLIIIKIQRFGTGLLYVSIPASAISWAKRGHTLTVLDTY